MTTFNNFLKRVISTWLNSYEYDFAILENGKKPIRAYKNDAGYDLFISKAVKIPAGKIVNVPTGIACKSRRPAWIMLTGRSSTLIKYGLMVNDAVIDGDFTGELFVKVFNTTKKEVFLPPNVRIAQIIVLPHTIMNIHFVHRLPSSKHIRGGRGFGSSGE